MTWKVTVGKTVLDDTATKNRWKTEHSLAPRLPQF